MQVCSIGHSYIITIVEDESTHQDAQLPHAHICFALARFPVDIARHIATSRQKLCKTAFYITVKNNVPFNKVLSFPRIACCLKTHSGHPGISCVSARPPGCMPR